MDLQKSGAFSASGAREAVWPLEVRDLDDDERFALWSLRRHLSNGPEDRVLVHEWDGRFGASAREGLDLLAGYIAWVGRGARRPVRYHPPCCKHVAADEIVLVKLLIAAQAGDTALVRSHGAWLFTAEMAPRVVVHTQNLADFFGEHGVVFSCCSRACVYFQCARAAYVPVLELATGVKDRGEQ